MNHFTGAAGRLVMASLLLPAISGIGMAQEETAEAAPRPRVASDVDPQARLLFDKAMELMDYKQYERGLAMLNTVVRDNQGSILSHQAHMAMGKHYLEQRATAEALSHFMLLTRVLAPVPGEKQPEDLETLYHEALFQAGFAQYQAGQYAAGFPAVPPPHRGGRQDQVGEPGVFLHRHEPLSDGQLEQGDRLAFPRRHRGGGCRRRGTRPHRDRPAFLCQDRRCRRAGHAQARPGGPGAGEGQQR